LTKERVRDLTDIMARVLHYQDRGEPSWQEMDYAGTKREYDELPKEIIDRYRNDAKFHAQVQRAVSMVLELDRSAVEPPAPQICHWRCCTKPMAPGDSYLCAEHRALFGPALNRSVTPEEKS
jgi:hypothetical protein